MKPGFLFLYLSVNYFKINIFLYVFIFSLLWAATLTCMHKKGVHHKQPPPTATPQNSNSNLLVPVLSNALIYRKPEKTKRKMSETHQIFGRSSKLLSR